MRLLRASFCLAKAVSLYNRSAWASAFALSRRRASFSCPARYSRSTLFACSEALGGERAGLPRSELGDLERGERGRAAEEERDDGPRTLKESVISKNRSASSSSRFILSCRRRSRSSASRNSFSVRFPLVTPAFAAFRCRCFFLENPVDIRWQRFGNRCERYK